MNTVCGLGSYALHLDLTFGLSLVNDAELRDFGDQMRVRILLPNWPQDCWPAGSWSANTEITQRKIVEESGYHSCFRERRLKSLKTSSSGVRLLWSETKTDKTHSDFKTTLRWLGFLVAESFRSPRVMRSVATWSVPDDDRCEVSTGLKIRSRI